MNGWGKIPGAALLALAVLWYIFLRGGNGGCTAHHFEKYRNLFNFRVKAKMADHPCCDYDYKIIVERREYSTCEHKGCNAKDRRWSETETLEKTL